MIGDCIKGILFTAFLGFALVGIATVVPDSAWDRVPPRLLPVRTFLAEKGVINEKYCGGQKRSASTSVPAETSVLPETGEVPEESHSKEAESGFVCSGGVCHVRGREETPMNLQSRGGNLQEEPIDDDLSEEELSLAGEMPQESVSGSPADSRPQSSEEESEPAFVPVRSQASSGDTLPDLGFGEDSFPEDEFPVAGGQDLLVRGAEQDDFVSSRGKKGNPIKSTNHNELNRLSDVEDFQGNEYTYTRNGSTAGAPSATPLIPAYESASQASSNNSASQFDAAEPSLHDQIAEWVKRSEGPGAIASSFIHLSKILDENDAELNAEDRAVLNNALDRLAYRVFYQPGEFVLWNEYPVKKGETLAEIARQYQVTPEFLAAINSLHLKPNDPLPEGSGIKVVRGPVSADISLSKKELLLKFNGLYAGRFKMGCAERAAQVRGDFPVTRKIQNPEYNGPLEGGNVGRIAGGDPKNPLGPYWIELEGGLGLQGTNHEEYVGQQVPTVGGLIFSNKDITHLNILLAEGAVIHVED